MFLIKFEKMIKFSSFNVLQPKYGTKKGEVTRNKLYEYLYYLLMSLKKSKEHRHKNNKDQLYIYMYGIFARNNCYTWMNLIAITQLSYLFKY